jgi:hypothetical protein
MDISAMAKIDENLKKLASLIVDSEELLITPLAVKMYKLASEYPTDPTVVGIMNYLQKKAKASCLTVKRGDLKEVYDAFYVTHTVASKYLSDELNLKKESSVTFAKHAKNEGELIDDSSSFVDQSLKNELQSVLDKSFSKGAYSEDLSKRAVQACLNELSCLGKDMTPAKLEVLVGDSENLICRAAYNTPKGESSILIPVEVKDGCTLCPVSFITNEGFSSINAENIVHYIEKTAGKVMHADGSKLLNYVKLMKTASTSGADAIDYAVMMLSASNADNALMALANESLEVKTDVKDSEFKTIEEQLTSTIGAAEFVLGKNSVNISRQLLSNKLGSIGYRNALISIDKFDKSNILFAVNLGKFAFRVPVYFKDNRAVLSDVVIANGSMYEFSTRGLSELFKVGEVDVGAIVKSSQIDIMSPSEIVGIVRQAMIENNFEKAEAALEWLKSAKDEKAYSIAIEEYKKGLRGDLVKQASNDQQKVGCSAPIKVSSSIHLVCSHLNLPITQVYQDEKGKCRPLYRKRMEDSSEGVAFMNSKIFI